VSQYTYDFNIRLPNGVHQRVEVQESPSGNAKSTVEAQFGTGCVRSGPPRKH
jgi:hypothetical protein